MHAMASRDDDRTVILAQDDAWSADSPLTDYDPALRPPPLAQRLLEGARRRPLRPLSPHPMRISLGK